MKSRFLSLTLILLTLWSCGSDDESGNQNSINLNGQRFKITTATLLEIADDTEVYTSIQFIGLNSNGTFKDLAIALFRAPGESIEGTYTFPEANGRYLDDWLTSYTDYSDQNNPLDYHLLEGTATIDALGGNKYKVSVNMTMDGEKVFTGFYKGEFQTGMQ